MSACEGETGAGAELPLRALVRDEVRVAEDAEARGKDREEVLKAGGG